MGFGDIANLNEPPPHSIQHRSCVTTRSELCPKTNAVGDAAEHPVLARLWQDTRRGHALGFLEVHEGARDVSRIFDDLRQQCPELLYLSIRQRIKPPGE